MIQSLSQQLWHSLHLGQHLHYFMNTADYWLLGREYSIGNATVAALQFWAADLEAHVLSNTIEQVYNAFFYTTSKHLLHQQSEEVLFAHFVTMLNTAFENKLALEDEWYESGSDNFIIPTPLKQTPRIHHVSSDDNISFDPLLHTAQLPASHIASLYDASYHSVPLIMKKVLQLIFKLLTAQHHHRTPWVLYSSHMTSPSIPWWPRRWRGRGFPNSTTRWWPLDYRRNPGQTSMYTQTFSATFTVSLPMSIYGLYFYIVPWHIRSQWHFWIWRLEDHIQWQGYFCSRWQDWILKPIDYG